MLGLDKDVSDVMESPAEMVSLLEKKFREKTREEWTKEFEHANACVAPVLDLAEVGEHPHHK